jgi:hypothetical protein
MLAPSFRDFAALVFFYSDLNFPQYLFGNRADGSA